MLPRPCPNGRDCQCVDVTSSARNATHFLHELWSAQAPTSSSRTGKATRSPSALRATVDCCFFDVFGISWSVLFASVAWRGSSASTARDFVSTVACWNLELDWRGKGERLRSSESKWHCDALCKYVYQFSWFVMNIHYFWRTRSVKPRGTITRSQFLAMMYRCGICGKVLSSIKLCCDLDRMWRRHTFSEWMKHSLLKEARWLRKFAKTVGRLHTKSRWKIGWVGERQGKSGCGMEEDLTWGCETWAASHNRQTFGKACQSPSSSSFLKETKHLWALWIWILMPKRSWISEAQSHKDFEMPGVDIFARNYNAEAMSQQPEECRGELLKKYKTLTQAWHEGVARWNCKISIEGINRSQMITDCWLPGIDPGHLEIVDLKVALCCPHELSETANMLPVLLLRNEFYRFYWTLAGLCWCLQGCTSPQRWQGNQLRNTEFKGSTATLCDKDPIPFSIDSVAADRHMI